MRKIGVVLGFFLVSSVATAEYGCSIYGGSAACDSRYPFCEYDWDSGQCRETEGNACWYFDGEPQDCEAYSDCCWYNHQVNKCNSSCPSWQNTTARDQCGSRYQPSAIRRS